MTFHYYSSLQMYLLVPLLEAYVRGYITTWPRVILRFLFTLPPTTFTATSLTAFFFGNGLPCAMAMQVVRGVPCWSHRRHASTTQGHIHRMDEQS
jgi:hypothetical protein